MVAPFLTHQATSAILIQVRQLTQRKRPPVLCQQQQLRPTTSFQFQSVFSSRSLSALNALWLKPIKNIEPLYPRAEARGNIVVICIRVSMDLAPTSNVASVLTTRHR